MADEIYDKILYDDATHTPFAAIAPDLFTLTFNGLSKAYRVAGFRSAWLMVTGPKRHAASYLEGITILANMRLCANVPAQHAIQIALGGRQSINDLVLPGGRLREQRDAAMAALKEIPGVTCVQPQGALYVFPRLDPDLYPIEDDQPFVLHLLREQHVLVVQGSGFNWPHPDHLRIVTLPRADDLTEAIGRIGTFLAGYRGRNSARRPAVARWHRAPTPATGGSPHGGFRLNIAGESVAWERCIVTSPGEPHAGQPRRPAAPVPHLRVLGTRPVAGERACETGGTELEKEAWVSDTLLEWGSCGQLAYVDRARPATSCTRRRPTSRARWRFRPRRSAPDAVLLMTRTVLPEFAGGGLGRMLVQGVARDVAGAVSRRSRPSAAPATAADEGKHTACCRPTTCSRSGSRPCARTANTRGCGWT